MIFAGTVLSAAPADRANAGTIPAVQLSFRVDEAIAGVQQGQILTINEWAAAWAMHRPMLIGQHILVFLYTPSRLGLTSPVGGSLGQVDLDARGKNVAAHALKTGQLQSKVLPGTSGPDITENVTVVQLERAIRSARQE
jgi:hypothetical protein